MEIRYEDQILVLRFEAREWGVKGGKVIREFENRMIEHMKTWPNYNEETQEWRVHRSYEPFIRELAAELFHPGQQEIFDEGG
jgi:hypothetical protein